MSDPTVAARLLSGTGCDGALVIVGGRGSGRTTMLRRLAAQLDDHDLVWIAGASAESPLPYAAVADLVPVTTDLEPMTVARALTEHLGRLASERPTALCIDNADDLDAESVKALAYATRRAPVLCLVATAQESVWRMMLPEATFHSLAPLDDDEMHAVVAACAVPVIPEVRRRAMTLAGGNPGAVVELIVALTPQQVSGVAPVVPWRVTELFRDRFLKSLSEPQRTVALLAGVEPGISADALARAAETLGIDKGVIDELERTDVLRTDGGGDQLDIPAVGSALYSLAVSADRRSAHLALADAMPESAPHRRAWHRAMAAGGPDDELAQDLERLSPEAFYDGGVSSVADLLLRAAELSTVPRDRGRRLAAAAESAWLAGTPERARTLIARAQEHADITLLRSELAYVQGSTELAAGSIEIALQTLTDAVRAASSATLPADAASAMMVRALDACLMSGEVAIAQELDQLSNSHAGPGALADSRRGLIAGTARMLAEDYPGAVPLLEPLSRETPGDGTQGELLVALRAAHVSGDFVRLLQHADKVLDRIRESGSIGLAPSVTVRQALAELMIGRLDNAAAIARAGAGDAELLGQHNNEAEHRSLLAVALARKGDWDGAVATAEQALRLSTGHGHVWSASLATWALGELELDRGRSAEAFTRFSSLWDGGRFERHPIVALYATPGLVEAAERMGRSELGDDAFSRLVSWADATGHAWVAALVERCRGLRAVDPGEAEQALRRALILHGEAGFLYDCARTHLALGERLRRDRRREECRTHLRQALETFESLASASGVARARAELRASGESRRPADSDAASTLTPQERTIANLVAQGLSNRDVASQLSLSARTVEFHLRNIFKKVNVSSRTELIARRAAAPPDRAG